MSEMMDWVDGNGTWYKTDERRREDGKIWVRWILSDEADIAELTYNLSKEVNVASGAYSSRSGCVRTRS